MARKSTYFKVGVFTIAALLIFAAAVLFFGLSQAFKPLLKCETFFNHSVQGLRNGASVQFRGFTVGSVGTIGITQFPGVTGGRQMVKVEFTVDPSLITGVPDQDVQEARKFLESEIKRGLRIYLGLQGVSGITYLNLDYIEEPRLRAIALQDELNPLSAAGVSGDADDDGGDDLPGDGLSVPPLPGDAALVIPNVPSTILEIGESMTQIVRTFRDIDFKTLVDRSTMLVSNLEELTAQLNQGDDNLGTALMGAVVETKNAAGEVSLLAKNMNSELTLFLHGNQLKELELAVNDARRAVNRLDNLIKSPQAALPATMDNLRVMSENLREFSELARRYPSQILLGGPPPAD
ncbi:MAG: MlaD family protein [Deltaproteobacteria bacterium]|jgi:hypothetical protein|nr:MlaD family protein [Deltaproteobacteria bacterium]